jgi:adenine phosphoribosyltransferase
MNYDDYIDKIPNFPKEGILFYDIAPLLYNQLAFKSIIEEIAKNIEACKPDLIVAIESRGFLVASALSIIMDKGFLMVRKKGKTPGKTISYEYQLEYGTDLLEIRENINIKDKSTLINILINTYKVNRTFEDLSAYSLDDLIYINKWYISSLSKEDICMRVKDLFYKEERIYEE